MSVQGAAAVASLVPVGQVIPRRVLISVADKTDLVQFGKVLLEAGTQELIASGGTATVLEQGGLPVTTVDDLTGFPEILGGRVKTLHPTIHAGILACRTQAHLDELEQFEIRPIDMVVGNLYPFGETVRSGASEIACMENVDIGGVALLRAAAKNWREGVIVVPSPNAYGQVADRILAGGVDAEYRRLLAKRTFELTSKYDTAIAAYL